jgi:DNA-binding response OmpR family regulator
MITSSNRSNHECSSHGFTRCYGAPRHRAATVLDFGRLVINQIARSVSLDGQAVALSSNEFELLLHLARNAGQVQSRASLFLELYGREYDGADRILDVRISNLRRKLGEADSSERIKTIWGQGYLFIPNPW